jgi:hypothetical protein
MKALYNGLTVFAVLAIAIMCWLQFVEYKHRNDDAYNAQCPNPSHEYFDCDWWPKKN